MAWINSLFERWCNHVEKYPFAYIGMTVVVPLIGMVIVVMVVAILAILALFGVQTTC